MHLSTLKKRLRLISFGETGDLAVEAVLNTQRCRSCRGGGQATGQFCDAERNGKEIECETFNDIQGVLKAEALLDALTGTLGDIKANNVFRDSG